MIGNEYSWFMWFSRGREGGIWGIGNLLPVDNKIVENRTTSNLDLCGFAEGERVGVGGRGGLELYTSR